MKHPLSAWLGFSGIALGAAALGTIANGQPKTIEDSVTGHIVRPAQLEPTSQRIANLKLPAGFQIRKWAQMQNPRVIAVAPDGTVYVSQREPGNLVMLRDTNRDGRADIQKIVATRKGIHGIALRGNQLFFTTVKEIYVAERKRDGSLSTPRLLLNNLPDGGQHPNRTLGFGPDKKMYITVGSTCNACDEPNAENATILRADSNGKNRRIFASGLRNTIGFGWHPVSKKLFGFDHGIDWLGDNEQSEELNEIQMGKRYGWPYIYENGKKNLKVQPPAAYSYEDWAKMSKAPTLTYRPHSAPMQMIYYTGNQFPAQYKNDAFIAMRGSWNRQPPSGYELVRVRFNKNGNPTAIEPFLTGFLLPEGTSEKTPGHIGRLVGLTQLPDGSLLLGDDTNNTIYRISYGAKNGGRAQTSAMDTRKVSLQLPETDRAKNSIYVRASFPRNGTIPFNNTAYGKNISPSLSWSGVPKNAKSIVMMMEDPDSLSPKPFVHWLMVNISPKKNYLPMNLPEGDSPKAISGAMQGAGNGGKVGYFGPKPPADGIAHRYHFQIFALDKKLNLPSGFNRQALLDAIKNHVLAKGEVVGTFKRNPA